MIRVVLDTNVYISALMFGGLPGAVLDLALLGSFQLVISPVLLDELCEKPEKKFGVPLQEVALIGQGYRPLLTLSNQRRRSMW